MQKDQRGQGQRSEDGQRYSRHGEQSEETRGALYWQRCPSVTASA